MLKIITEEIGLHKRGCQLAGEYSDMQHSGVKLSLVRIPRVIKEICTLNVLVMEHYEGIRLSDAIDMEKQHLAKALGMQDGEELKTVMEGKMRKQQRWGRMRSRMWNRSCQVWAKGCIGWTKVGMLIVPMEKGSTMVMSWLVVLGRRRI
jgi:hypothetical protein